jgi:hypothetical protein
VGCETKSPKVYPISIHYSIAASSLTKRALQTDEAMVEDNDGLLLSSRSGCQRGYQRLNAGTSKTKAKGEINERMEKAEKVQTGAVGFGRGEGLYTVRIRGFHTAHLTKCGAPHRHQGPLMKLGEARMATWAIGRWKPRQANGIGNVGPMPLEGPLEARHPRTLVRGVGRSIRLLHGRPCSMCSLPIPCTFPFPH